MLRKYSERPDAVDWSLCKLTALKDQDASDRILASSLGTSESVVKALRGLADKIGMTSLSTAYSGIDAPGTSVLQIIAGLETEYSIKAQHPQHLWGMEWNSHCQVELQQHPAAAQCLFGDLQDFIVPRVRRMVPELLAQGRLTTVLQPLVAEHPERVVTLFPGCML